jgi:hypothetical protein
MKIKIKYLTYLAGAIEHVSSKEMKTWRQELTEKLASPDLVIYDPVAQESSKVGKPSGEQVKYIQGLKQAGHWKKFEEEMQKIWWGSIRPDNHIFELFMAMRTDAILKGSFIEDLPSYGDYEAVARSEFIIVYLPKDTKTVGTIYEIMLAFLLHIPIYLILPDHPKTEANSSLLYGVMVSGGDVFYSVNDCVKFIKEKYQLKEIEKVEEKKDDKKEA